MKQVSPNELNIGTDIFTFVGNVGILQKDAYYEVWARDGKYISDRKRQNECTCVVRRLNKTDDRFQNFGENTKVISHTEFFDWLYKQPYNKTKQEVDSRYWHPDDPDKEIEEIKSEKKKKKINIFLSILYLIFTIIYVVFYFCLVILLAIIAPKAVKSLPKFW